MDALLDAPLAQPRLGAALLSALSLAALLLSAIGLYTVIAASVQHQTRELGVRMALGATAEGIRRFVLAQQVGVIAVGILAGLAGAMGTSRPLQSLLFQASAIDPATLIGVCVLLGGVATIAGYVPARRASRIDPMEALRAEQ